MFFEHFFSALDENNCYNRRIRLFMGINPSLLKAWRFLCRIENLAVKMDGFGKR